MCHDGAGASTAHMSGDVTLEGARVPFVDAPLSTEVAGLGADFVRVRLALPLPAFELGGTRFAGTPTIRTAERRGAGPSPRRCSAASASSRSTARSTPTRAAWLTAHLAAGVGVALGGVTFGGEVALTLAGGVWRVTLAGGELTLPGGVALTLAV